MHNLVHVGDYWVSPEDILFCKDDPKQEVPSLLVTLRLFGGSTTDVWLEGEARGELIAWLQANAREVGE